MCMSEIFHAEGEFWVSITKASNAFLFARLNLKILNILVHLRHNLQNFR